MTPAIPDDANVILKAPEGMEDCDDLHVHRDEEGKMWSLWEPTDEERTVIANGGRVVLIVRGPVHPPVSLLGVES